MANEVHIWSACLLDYENALEYFTSILSKDEYERAKNFRFFRDQKRFIIARAILRLLLSKYLKMQPQKIEILYGLWGKPVLSEKNNLYFNLSHSGDYALYALARNYDVGIDLEYIDQGLELKTMVLNLFSSNEINYWKTLRAKEKVHFFFKFWTCKEALLKALGKGWLTNEKEMSLKNLYAIDRELKNYFLKSRMAYPYYFECIPGYASALFVNGPILQPIFFYNWNHIDLDL